MLLTLNASCLRSLLLGSGRVKKPKLDLLDLPRYTKETLGLAGINLSTDLLAGADRARLEAVRERADRASCANLLLIEADVQPFGVVDETAAKGAVERVRRVIEAASILGCSSVAVSIKAEDSDEALVRAATRLKPVMERADKLDLNLLISPTNGLTARPERVTELLKKVGGFRIGTFPDFEAASKSADPLTYLNRLTPYATAVCASTVKFKVPEAKPAAPKKGAKGSLEEKLLGAIMSSIAPKAQHDGYDLISYVSAVTSVGYEGPLALDYRGTGDAEAGLIASRDALLNAFGDHAADDDDLMDLDGEVLDDEAVVDAEEETPDKDAE
jgi:sugar phosphate isomerase/epimerase